MNEHLRRHQGPPAPHTYSAACPMAGSTRSAPSWRVRAVHTRSRGCRCIIDHSAVGAGQRFVLRRRGRPDPDPLPCHSAASDLLIIICRVLTIDSGSCPNHTYSSSYVDKCSPRDPPHISISLKRRCKLHAGIAKHRDVCATDARIITASRGWMVWRVVRASKRKLRVPRYLLFITHVISIR